MFATKLLTETLWFTKVIQNYVKFVLQASTEMHERPRSVQGADKSSDLVDHVALVPPSALLNQYVLGYWCTGFEWVTECEFTWYGGKYYERRKTQYLPSESECARSKVLSSSGTISDQGYLLLEQQALYRETLWQKPCDFRKPCKIILILFCRPQQRCTIFIISYEKVQRI